MDGPHATYTPAEDMLHGVLPRREDVLAFYGDDIAVSPLGSPRPSRT
jgi:hypothetical protein